MKLLPRATMLAFALATALLAAPRVPAQSTPGEVLYLSDVVNIGDSRSRLYTVTLNATNGRAELTLLPNGEIPFDLVFAVAALPNGSRIYAVDSLTPGFGNGSGRLGYYDVAAATFTVVGPVMRTDPGTTVQDVVQAAFSPSGELFILNNSSNVFRVDVTTAQATFLGQVRNQATNAVLDVQGGDLAFDVAGNAFIFTRFGTANAPRGLYRVMFPGSGGTVPAIFVGGSYAGTISGMAFRANGTGALVASSDSDNTVVTLDTTTGAVVGAAFPLFLNGTPFDHADGGDMSTGLLNRPQMTNTLAAAADTYVRGGAPNTNEGGAVILRIQDSSDNRALVRFDQAAIAALVAGRPVLSARLQLTITQIANNWGPTGRTVDAHRLTANWVEGNGFDEDNPRPGAAAVRAQPGTAPSTATSPTSRPTAVARRHGRWACRTCRSCAPGRRRRHRPLR
jgi:hypothetical protein